MTTVSDICDQIGRGRIADSLGVGTTAVSNAVVAGAFPAKWYLVVHQLCLEAGIECPQALFNFTSVAPPFLPALKAVG